jgi:hypothetical protein
MNVTVVNHKWSGVNSHNISYKEHDGFTKLLFVLNKLLWFCVQVLEPVLKTLVNNFVTERNSADVIAIG